MAERRFRYGRRRRWRTDQPLLSAAQAGREGLRQIAELTGKDPEGVTGVEPSQDGWLVTVEVVEDRRIPSSTDILVTYETEIDRRRRTAVLPAGPAVLARPRRQRG